MLERGLGDMAAFHAQQTAEFALKALEVHSAGKFTRTHDLTELARRVGAPPRIVNLCAALTPAYVAAPLPGCPGNTNHENPRRGVRGRGEEDPSMSSPSDSLIRDLRRFRRKVARQFGIEAMILFGSRARGRPRPDSDVDLVVVGHRFRRKNPIDRAAPLHLAWDIRLPVDFLCYTPEEFDELSKRPSIVREALREGVIVPP